MLQNITPSLNTILQDLSRNGVSDIMGETPHNWFAKPTTALKKSYTPAQIETVTSKQKITPAKIEIFPKPKSVVPPILTGKAEQLLVITGSLENSPALTTKETELLTNMLKAIKIDISKSAILAVPVADKYGTPFANINAYKKEALNPAKKMIAKATPPAVLALGQIATYMATAEDLTLSEAREKPNLTCNFAPLAITYHPRTLLKQPLLKRMAWQDLLAFQNRLKET